MITLIAAVANNGVIGSHNAMPWKLKRDLAYFRENTLHKPIIMGRKTFLSVGKPLPKRLNIILTSQGAIAGAVVCNEAQKALAVASGFNARRLQNDIMIVGGGEIYKAFMPIATRLLITHINASPNGEVFFPAIDEKKWQKRILFNHKSDEDNDFDCFFVEYVKVA